MSAKFESSIREIPYPQLAVYQMLSDLSNLEKVRDKIPEDKLKDLNFDADSVSINSPLGAVQLNIIERDAPKCIKFQTQQSPIPLTLWIQIVPVTAQSSKMKLTIQAEVNMLMKGMIKKPLQEGIEKVADVLQMIHYE
ncbi:SRPBCC family protein [Hoylesella timonensis]|uniref:SRPBCC family protein n=1 Tax=Hoylesella timonensis TaxID=386414 RepID=UPI00242ADF3D|nr:SRPBCC family protein [Hoylesella timonensis]